MFDRVKRFIRWWNKTMANTSYWLRFQWYVVLPICFINMVLRLIWPLPIFELVGWWAFIASWACFVLAMYDIWRRDRVRMKKLREMEKQMTALYIKRP